MARIKNNFNVTREQIELIIEALGNAECWMIHVGDLHPEFRRIYDEDVERFIDLEMMLRGLVNKPIA